MDITTLFGKLQEHKMKLKRINDDDEWAKKKKKKKSLTLKVEE